MIEDWWKEFAKTVKHIHYYNQLVVYEKGPLETPFATRTVGSEIPLQYSGEHEKVEWESVMRTLREYKKA